MKTKPLGVAAGVMFALALVLLYPVVLSPSALLIGNPEIDVWNHAWGYFYVAHQLGEGSLLQTTLAGGPDGGLLWFIDTPGALATLPLTWLFGPAVAYNTVLVVRVALAGIAAWCLAKELGATQTGALVGGVAYMTTPFLMCELANGISEVCATQWVCFALWAAARACRTWSRRDFLLLGLFGGLTAAVSFYQGLAGALAIGALFAWKLPSRWRREGRPPGLLLNLVLSGVVAVVLLLPVWMAFKGSLDGDSALIKRGMELDLALLAHNAVDPRVFFWPGDFQSVDLAGIYGEPFVHTGYLRWSVVLLAGFGAWKASGARGWWAVGLWGLVLGMGSYLWFDGDWVKANGRVLALPFEWLRMALPQIAITHPLRLSLPAQAIFCALAGVGASHLPRARIASAIAGGLVVVEGLFGSSAAWPIPTSSAVVPSYYSDVGDGMVLDLPAEVGTGMATSRYFWFQTVHERPIPYTPDVRMGSARDPLLKNLGVEKGPGPTPRPSPVAEGLRARYALVVVHKELEIRAGIEGAYLERLQKELGAPEETDDAWIWRLR